MADDNRPLKYMRYAIGEIVLVVIGILIALQINNWNENKIAQERINDRLGNIVEELESDITEMNRVLYACEGRIIVSKKILENSNRIGSFIDWEPILESNANSQVQKAPNVALSWLLGFDCNNSVYNEIVNSGELYLIRDRTLLNKIQQYYSDALEINKRELNNNKTSWDNISKSKSRLGIGMYAKDVTLKKLIQLATTDKQFGSEIENEYAFDVYQHHSISELKLQAEELMTLINSKNK